MTTTAPPAKVDYAAVLKGLESRYGELLPADVIEYARPPDSPLHGYFEWDDEAAADKFRLIQAEALIRRVRLEVVIEEERIIAPVYVSIAHQRDNGRIYGSLRRIRQAQAKVVLLDELRRLAGNIQRVVSIARCRGNPMMAAESLRALMQAATLVGKLLAEAEQENGQ